MPISPENKQKYPKDWPEIRQRILARAKNKCENCGVDNNAIGFRDKESLFHYLDDADLYEAEHYWIDIPEKAGYSISGFKIFKIVLTIAHLDHNPENCNDDNLKALCQLCHNRHDAKHRAQTRKEKREAGQLKLGF